MVPIIQNSGEYRDMEIKRSRLLTPKGALWNQLRDLDEEGVLSPFLGSHKECCSPGRCQETLVFIQGCQKSAQDQSTPEKGSTYLSLSQRRMD